MIKSLIRVNRDGFYSIAIKISVIAINLTSCTEECEPMAPADIQEHLEQIEGKWIINKRSSIFDARGWNCEWEADTAYISPTAFGFDVLLIATVGTNCRFVDTTYMEGVQVLAQHNGKFLYQPAYGNGYHYDVEVILDTLSFNPPDDIYVDTLLTGNGGNFELMRSRY